MLWVKIKQNTKIGIKFKTWTTEKSRSIKRNHTKFPIAFESSARVKC